MLTQNENETCYKRFGFVPTSVWYFAKTASLQSYVADEIAEGTYAREYDVGANRLSQFNPVVAEKIIKIWSKEDDHILDPFAGRCRALMARLLKRKYLGFEISPKVCKQLQDNLNRPTLVEFSHKPVVLNDDSRNINFKNQFDLVFSCPPYWDVEDYNDAYQEKTVGQLSDLHDYKGFLVVYGEIIKRLFDALKPGKFAVWVVADIRRNKTLIPFHADTIRLFEEAGFKTHDVIINKINTLAVMGVGAAIDNGYTPKAHEYILVFKKP